jgi:hypothetical protein
MSYGLICYNENSSYSKNSSLVNIGLRPSSTFYAIAFSQIISKFYLTALFKYKSFGYKRFVMLGGNKNISTLRFFSISSIVFLF